MLITSRSSFELLLRIEKERDSNGPHPCRKQRIRDAGMRQKLLRGAGISKEARPQPWAAVEQSLACCGICLEELQGRLPWS